MGKIIQGRFNSAIVYREDLEQYTQVQIDMICNNPIYENAEIALMPDTHPGKVGPIGLTMRIPYNKYTCIMPALIGNDIGCGISWAKIKLPKKQKHIDFATLTKTIDETIASAKSMNYMYGVSLKGIYGSDPDMNEADILDVMGYNCINALGTLGEGNHFIELDKHDDDLYIIVHSGSRGFGNYIYEKYMRLARENSPEETPYELSYISGDTLESYLLAVEKAEVFAKVNRSLLISRICNAMKWDVISDTEYSIAHNTIFKHDDELILTKGANCVKGNAHLCIPINSVEGCIIAHAKENADYIFTPHGSGRGVKKVEATNQHTASEYKKLMTSNNVYCNDYKSTVNESPFVYRTYDDIKDYLQEVLDIDTVIQTKPIYNYKSVRGGNK